MLWNCFSRWGSCKFLDKNAAPTYFPNANFESSKFCAILLRLRKITVSFLGLTKNQDFLGVM